MKPIRVQLSRKKGFRLPPNTVKVDRSTVYGNRYKIGGLPTMHVDGCIYDVPDAATAVRLHREEIEYWLAKKPDATRALLEPLRGKNLADWCRIDAPCHADVLLELANK